MRLLYIDDDRINVLLFQEVCRMAGGLELESAVTGAEALALAREFKPELMVIDLHLPDTDGLSLLPRLRAEEGLAGVPAFLCSADDPEQLRHDAARAGFTGCWTKPVDLRVVLADLASIAAARRA